VLTVAVETCLITHWLHTGEDCYAANDGATTVAPVTPATTAPTEAAAATVAPTEPVVAKPTAKPVVVPVPGDETVAPTAVSFDVYVCALHCSLQCCVNSLTL
jgi:hypothetical protein